jgi:mannose-6-phosphate isomerase-like protein (cupin superfamily)
VAEKVTASIERKEKTMQKKLLWSAFVLLLVLSVASQGTTQAGGPAQGRGQAAAAPGKPAPPNMPGDFTFIPKADTEAMMGPTRGDRPMRVVNIGGGANLGAYILHYPTMKNTSPTSFYHAEISELYYVIRGEGTALLGGELENARMGDPNGAGARQITGPTVNGTMKGYKTQKWSPGDIIIIPPGVPHMIGYEVTVPNDILRIVVDPKRAINLVPSQSAALAQDRARTQEQAQGQAAAAPPGKPAPSNMPGNFTFIPKADTEALMGPTRGDRPARVVNVGSGANLGAFILHYETMKNTLPVSSFYHSEVSELYYVIRGEGTALLGGELEKATWDDPNSTAIKEVRGPSVNGTMKGYQTQKWTAGDMIIVSAGVPHSMGFEVTAKTDILRIAVDPKRALQLK